MHGPEAVAFLKWALPRLGLRWEGFRRVRGQVEKRVDRRIRALGLADLDAYRRRLETDPSEWRVLDDCCRVTISRFHRDRGVFEHLRTSLLPELARAARDAGERALRVWSCGCASGEEAWSIAIAFRLDVDVPDLDLDLVATDADPRLLERAKVGCYERGSLHEVPTAWLEAAFEARDDRHCVRETFRRGVVFRAEDVRREMPDGPFRLVSCRNLAFTYFDAAGQRAVLEGIARRLAPGGALVLGAHERLPSGAPMEMTGPLPIVRV